MPMPSRYCEFGIISRSAIDRFWEYRPEAGSHPAARAGSFLGGVNRVSDPAITHLDLSAILAGIVCNLIGSQNTSIRLRFSAVRCNAESAGDSLLQISDYYKYYHKTKCTDINYARTAPLYSSNIDLINSCRFNKSSGNCFNIINLDSRVNLCILFFP